MRKPFSPKRLNVHTDLSLYGDLKSNRQLDLRHLNAVQLAWVLMRPCVNLMIMGALILFLAAHCREKSSENRIEKNSREEKTFSISNISVKTSTLPQSPATQLNASQLDAPSANSHASQAPSLVKIQRFDQAASLSYVRH